MVAKISDVTSGLECIQVTCTLANSSPAESDEPFQCSFKFLAPDGHLGCVKRVLHDIVAINLVYPFQHRLCIRLLRLRDEQELGASRRLKALQAEIRRVEHLEAGVTLAEGRIRLGV